MSEKSKEFFKNHVVRIITMNGIIAALYVALTLAFSFASYEYMQFRVSEFLTLLVFFNPWYTIGLTLGCLLANVFSTVGAIDILMGTSATLIACLINIGLSKICKSLLINGLVPCLVNAIMVPFIIWIGSSFTIPFNVEIYFIMFGWVFLGEFGAVIGVGYTLFMILQRSTPSLHKMLLSTQNTDFKW